MKIETSVSPQTQTRPPASPPGRKGAEAGATAPARDTFQISPEAAALQSAAEATKLAVDTRELVAGNNREAVLAQQVDTRRLQELMQTMGVTAQGSTSITA